VLLHYVLDHADVVDRDVAELKAAAAIPDGPYRCPKGLCHGYGVHAIGSGVPTNMLSK
jgi:integrase/recombinase XerD